MKNKNLSLKIIALQIVFGAAIFAFPIHVSADGLSLKVSPSLLQIQAKPPADIWTPFTIENQNSQPVSLQVTIKPFDTESSSNGTVVFLKNGQPFPGPDKNLFEKIHIVDTNNNSLQTINLGPKQQKTYRIHIDLPSDENPSDYYFTLLLQTTNQQGEQNQSNDNVEDQQSSSILQEGIGINTLLAIGDKEIPQVSINDFTTSTFYDNGPVNFHLSLFNGGAHFVSPKGQIVIKNVFGQPVGKITIPSSVILAGTSRTLFSANTILNANNISANSSSANNDKLLQLIWPSSFLIGPYQAQLTLTTSDDGPVYTRTVSFFAFPVKLFLGSILFLGILYGVYLRVKKKI